MHLTINPSNPDLDSLQPAIEALRGGRVIAYPTDTLYGLGADPRNLAAVDPVFHIMGRSEQQTLPLIAASLEQARIVGQFDDTATRLAERFWPGPLTLVLSQAFPLASGVAQRDTVAVRVPDHPVARTIAAGLGFPITSTSANRSDAPPSATAREVIDMIGADLFLIVDVGATKGGLPSTIVDVSSGAPRLVRAGAVAWDRVLESLK